MVYLLVWYVLTASIACLRSQMLLVCLFGGIMRERRPRWDRSLPSYRRMHDRRGYTLPALTVAIL